MKIILASASPRRQELLAGLDIDFTVKTLPDLDESFPDTLTGEEIPLYIARSKAEAYKQLIEPDQLVITADTIVWINDEVLGKPADEKEAVEMLQKLSGNMHEVITGVCLTTQQWQKSFAVTTQVTFDTLSNEEINYYVQKYKPMDKAGAYGVQEWIGYIGVAKLTGSYFNVMGLPVQRLYRELVELKVLGR
ncbi:Maf-like protein [Bacteroides sp. OttesenSCG-928-D19]|nr:Maf-like protein [Bacteroides sp. OttesenSCG-928-N06]MDL2305144.1 Maf-like protein [Bacteroides sp. OttesenSCG-928-D19]